MFIVKHDLFYITLKQNFGHYSRQIEALIHSIIIVFVNKFTYVRKERENFYKIINYLIYNSNYLFPALRGTQLKDNLFGGDYFMNYTGLRSFLLYIAIFYSVFYRMRLDIITFYKYFTTI